MTNTPPPPASVKENHRQLLIVCGALMAGIIIFSAVCVAIHSQNSNITGNTLPADALLLVVAALAAGCFTAARVLYGKRLQVLQQKQHENLHAKLTDYRTVLLLYQAFCEAGALFGVIGYFLTGNFIFLGITGLMLLAMFAKLPTKSRLISELQLDWQEQQELN